MKEKILITGSEGFIGSHLVETLIKKNYNIRAFVQYNSFSSIGWLEELSVENKKKIEIYFGDIRDFHSISLAIKGCSKIIHLAALIAIPYSYKSPKSYIDTNVLGTYNLLQAAREHKIKKIVHTSTSEVYGTAKFIPINEDHPLEAQSPYAASKIAADQLALSFNRSYNLPIVIIRPFNTFGPRQSLRAVIPSIIHQFLNNDKIISLGSLKPTRDFNYVEDIVDGFVCALNSKFKNAEVFNLGSNSEISIGTLVKKIKKLTNSNAKIKKDKERIRPHNSEVLRLLASNSKAKNILKWRPKYVKKLKFELALKKTIEWYSKIENTKKFDSEKFNI